MKLLESVDQLRVSLDYHLARHNILTANLAHIDTPGYRPKDLAVRADFEKSLKVAMAATDERHFGQHEEPNAVRFKVITDLGTPVGLDGNGVSVDREAVKIAANGIRYDTVAALAQGELSTLSWAANDGR